MKKRLFALLVVAAVMLAATSGLGAAHNLSEAQSTGQGKGTLLWSDSFAANLAGNVQIETFSGGEADASVSHPQLVRDGNVLRYVQRDGRTALQQEGMGAGSTGMQIAVVPEADRASFLGKTVFVEFEVLTNRLGGNMGLMVGGPGSNASYIRLQNRPIEGTEVSAWHLFENVPGGGTSPANWVQLTGEGTAIPHVENEWKTFTVWINTVTGANELYINGTLAAVQAFEMYAPGSAGGTVATFWYDVTSTAGNVLSVANINIYEAVAGGVAPGPVVATPVPTAPPQTGTIPSPDVDGTKLEDAPPTGDAFTFGLALVFGGLLSAAFVVRKTVKNNA